jgi:hypothetical protein
MTEAQPLLFIEDFNEELDSIFIEEDFKPYLKDLFTDLCLRSANPCKPKTNKNKEELKEYKEAVKEQMADRVTMDEFYNLPGMVSDRFSKLNSERLDGRVCKSEFEAIMIQVFCSHFEDKMKLTFKM